MTLNEPSSTYSGSKSKTITSAKTGESYEEFVIREGYRYKINCRYEDWLYYKCEDNKNLKCKGVWKRNFRNQDHQGVLHTPHSEPIENHTYHSERKAKGLE